MLIVCPTCGTTYNVGATSLGDSGRRVRCVRCAAVWVAAEPQPIATAAAKARPAALPEPDFAHAASRNGAAQDANAPPFAAHDDGQPGSAAPSAVAESEWAAGDAADRPTREAFVAPPLAPMELDALPRTPARAERAPIEDVESFALRRTRTAARRRRLYWPLGAIQTALVVLLVVDAVAIFWRGEVVRAFPQMASFYAAIGLPVNLRGLAFENIKLSRETHDGVAVLVVEGAIANVTSKTVEVPRMRFAVRNAAGHEVYTWTAVPSRTLLSAGEVLPFRSRLASPPPDANDVTVRFFSRRDARAGGG